MKEEIGALYDTSGNLTWDDKERADILNLAFQRVFNKDLNADSSGSKNGNGLE